MSKVAILGDLHIGAKAGSDTLEKRQRAFLNLMIETMKKEKVDTIFQLGDIFDSRKNIGLKSLRFAREFFDTLQKNDIKFYTLVGNHDIFYRESLEISSSDLVLEQYPNVTVFSEPTTLEFGGKTFDFIPWICNENKIACTEFIDQSRSDYCLGHLAINDFYMMANTVCSDGMDREFFGGYKRVFSGHFHLKSKGGNIIYVGTPYELNWGDAGSEKGFYILDTNRNYAKYIVNPEKMHKYVIYDAEGDSTDISSADLTDCFVRVVVRNKGDDFLYENFVNSIYKVRPADVKFVEARVMFESKETNGEAVVDDEMESLTDIIGDYINGLEIEPAKKDALKSVAVMLYNEALAAGEN